MTAICKICDFQFEKISLLKQHLILHINAESLEGVDLKSKLFLFDTTKITPSEETNETLINYLKEDITNSCMSRFYQITNKHGQEFDLSDSEAETEEMSVGGGEEGVDADEPKPSINLDKRTYNCLKCEKVFTRSYKFVQHMRFEHENESFEFKCLHCNREFLNEFFLNRHTKNHCENKLKEFNCAECKMKFMWKTSFEKHNQFYHTKEVLVKTEKKKRNRAPRDKPKEKNFTCEICSRSFFRQEHLDRHTKIHIPSEKKFECTVCEKKFNRKDNLR